MSLSYRITVYIKYTLHVIFSSEIARVNNLRSKKTLAQLPLPLSQIELAPVINIFLCSLVAMPTLVSPIYVPNEASLIGSQCIRQERKSEHKD